MKKIFMRYILPLLAIFALAGFDQLVKFWTIENIELHEHIAIWEGVFELTHIRNEGMAWGLLQNQQILFIALTPVALFVFAYFYFRAPFTKRFIPIRIAELLLAGGAIGNLVDRIFRGEVLFKGNVVDMFYVKLINFPVFNVADSYITIACVLLVVLVLFYYKDDEFNQMFGLPKKSVKEKSLTAEKEEKEDAENH